MQFKDYTIYLRWLWNYLDKYRHFHWRTQSVCAHSVYQHISSLDNHTLPALTLLNELKMMLTFAKQITSHVHVLLLLFVVFLLE